jgi:acyl carrier protein
MDAVEIVMAVEDAFDIRIEDAEAEKILTPAQLIDLVLSKTETATENICLTQRAFNLLRGALIHRCALTRKHIKPDAPLRTTILRPVRRAQLNQLACDLAIPRRPELVRPAWVKASLTALALLAGTAAVVATYKAIPSAAFLLWLPALAAALATAYVGIKATTGLEIDFPKGFDTIGDLARWVMTHKNDLATPATSAWTRTQVAARVREIVINVLGCESNYREDAHFIKDLGLS